MCSASKSSLRKPPREIIIRPAGIEGGLPTLRLQSPDLPSDMPFINRELSWLEFNQRVLEQSRQSRTPLLERVKFLAIADSNLDEFFQVRVGGLVMLQSSGSRVPDIAGLTPSQQIALIRKRVAAFAEIQYDLLNNALIPALAEAGIRILKLNELSQGQDLQVDSFFSEMIYPLLTPLAIEEEDPPPSIQNLRLFIACRIDNPEQQEGRYAFVPLPDNLPRFIPVQSSKGSSFVAIEDIVQRHLGELFPGETVGASSLFRITRNSDIAVQEEDAIDLAGEMAEVLAARRIGTTIRVQIAKGTPRDLLRLVQEVTRSGSAELYRMGGLLQLADLMQISQLSDHQELSNPPWPPLPSPLIDYSTPIFEVINARDVLLFHPYESFDPVIRMLEEAAQDPDVLAIKQVLYRTASDSRIISALIRAAENGKQVTVLVELKARFDEARNLQRAEMLQRAGVQIVYGVKDLKTHAKVTLIARNEDGRLKRYVHLGTGNYNETTAQLYTDVSYLTCRPQLVADASHFFNAVTGRSKLMRLQKICAAPVHLKDRIIELIEAEADRARHGEPALIMAKCNSLQDPDVIKTLYRASRAGVKIKLNIRGICCLKTESKRYSKNIEVRSIVDRYLEHARIFYFHHGGDPEVYFSSADWMTRNLEKRVELLVPVEDPPSKKRLIRILEAAFRDNTNAFRILKDGSSIPVAPAKGEKRFRFQEHLYKAASKAARIRQRERSTTFTPHRPPGRLDDKLT